MKAIRNMTLFNRLSHEHQLAAATPSFVSSAMAPRDQAKAAWAAYPSIRSRFGNDFDRYFRVRSAAIEKLVCASRRQKVNGSATDVGWRPGIGRKP